MNRCHSILSASRHSDLNESQAGPNQADDLHFKTKIRLKLSTFYPNWIYNQHLKLCVTVLEPSQMSAILPEKKRPEKK